MDPHSTAALITGCSTGIGRSTALALHEAGYPVYATARRAESLAGLADRGITTLPLDVTDEASMTSAVERVEAEHGAVGLLVNNAGYSLQAPVEKADMAEIRRQFETNFFGLVRLTQLVLPGMRRQGWGRVVNVGSMGGRFTFPGSAFYHATKHALEALSDGLRLEVAPFGIRVVLVQPGPVLTAFGDAANATIDAQPGPYADFERALAEQYARTYSGRSPEPKVRPEEVARIIVAAVAAEAPRARYPVGVTARVLMGLRRLAPDAAWDRLIRAAYPTPRA